MRWPKAVRPRKSERSINQTMAVIKRIIRTLRVGIVVEEISDQDALQQSEGCRGHHETTQYPNQDYQEGKETHRR